MIEVANNTEFFTALRDLIDAWCDRRCLKALGYVLPAYLAFNGLADAWGDVFVGLRNVSAFARDELTADERKTVSTLTNIANRVAHRRPAVW